MGGDSLLRAAAFGALAMWTCGCGADDDDASVDGGSDGGAAAGAATTGGALPRAESTNHWTWLGGDLRSTYHAAGETVLSVQSAPRLQEAWSIQLSASVNGAAAVVGPDLYVATILDVVKLDAETGDMRWRYTPAGTSSITYADGVIYNHSYQGDLYARDADGGNPMWRLMRISEYGASGFASPLVFDRYVIVGTSSNEEERVSSDARFRGEVIAFDKDDGEELWRHMIPDDNRNGSPVWSSPSVDVDAGMIFVTTGNNYTEQAGGSSDAILALDLATGDRLWTTQLTADDVYTQLNPQGPDYDFGTNPILFDAVVDGEMTELVGAGQKSGLFHALRRDDGEIVWSTTISRGGSIGGIINNGAHDGERILVASHTLSRDQPPMGTLMALDPGTGDVLWQKDHEGMIWAPITVGGGVGFVAFDRLLMAFDANNGDELWSIELEGSISSAPVISDGWVFVGSGVTFGGATPARSYHAFKVMPE